jgi:hypothetical protein
MANGYLSDTLCTRISNTYRWSVIIGLVIIAIFSVAAYFLAPKGENQLYVQYAAERRTKLI